ncbi:uncharacterized protein BDW43DRAFT_313430 [Aspergillus alliaceus]|uniref:uncharacterized protein n=1 Tax=Petromyces alliaceus TaxID=209559 RepID=UPI0012A49AF7|nr:uncharacterized protein BDW43DRAFT_313430 [Aspergillus alliaceus]KAB8231105.1 hypothetical protein BDW43DRAFT_313430 [Aspergillus alliaceus]
MLAALYQTVEAAWVEGRLENVLQRQKELAALHSSVKSCQTDLIAALCLDPLVTNASASEELKLSLDAIQQLYESLDFPSTLARERSIQAGRSSSSGLMPLGPTLIQASPSCPLSSVILPLAAAIAAGSCCLVLSATVPLRLELNKIIRSSLDQEAVSVAAQDTIDADDLARFHFGVAVLQDSATAHSVAAALRRRNPTARVHVAPSGLPAIFVDRSVADVDVVASWLGRTITQNPRQRPGRVPRLCFVDEFVIERLATQVQREYPGLEEAQNPMLDMSIKQDIADLLSRTFPSLQRKSILCSPRKVPALLSLERTDPVNYETINQVADLVTTHYPGMILVPTTSLDHGIDLWNKVNQGKIAQATYLFSASREAFYLSQSLNSEHFFVNHIPTRSFVMVAPTSDHESYELPFRTENFSRNKAISQIPLREPERVILPWQSRRGHLNSKKISQPVGGQVSYFEQGLLVGLSAAALTASCIAYLLAQGVKYYTR